MRPSAGGIVEVGKVAGQLLNRGSQRRRHDRGD